MTESRVSFAIAAPQACSPVDIEAFRTFVLNAGEVAGRSLPQLIAQARTLAFAWLDGSLVGVAAIKVPNKGYRDQVFQKAGVAGAAGFCVELGWVHVHEAARRQGISRQLVDKLLSAVTDVAIYATTRVENAAMGAILTRAGFVSIGAAYPSDRRDAEIQLFVRA